MCIKPRESKILSILLIFSFMLFYSPHFLTAKSPSNGNLIGFIYAEDGTTPVEGAVFKIKNVANGKVLESTKSDKLGIIKIEGIEEGFYIGGVTADLGDYNLGNIIGIKADTTAKVSISLKSPAEEENKKKKKALGAFFTSPAGIAVIIAATAAIIYTIVKLTEEEEEASPFK